MSKPPDEAYTTIPFDALELGEASALLQEYLDRINADVELQSLVAHAKIIVLEAQDLKQKQRFGVLLNRVAQHEARDGFTLTPVPDDPLLLGDPELADLVHSQDDGDDASSYTTLSSRPSSLGVVKGPVSRPQTVASTDTPLLSSQMLEIKESGGEGSAATIRSIHDDDTRTQRWDHFGQEEGKTVNQTEEGEQHQQALRVYPVIEQGELRKRRTITTGTDSESTLGDGTSTDGVPDRPTQLKPPRPDWLRVPRWIGFLIVVLAVVYYSGVITWTITVVNACPSESVEVSITGAGNTSRFPIEPGDSEVWVRSSWRRYSLSLFVNGDLKMTDSPYLNKNKICQYDCHGFGCER